MCWCRRRQHRLNNWPAVWSNSSSGGSATATWRPCGGPGRGLPAPSWPPIASRCGCRRAGSRWGPSRGPGCRPCNTTAINCWGPCGPPVLSCARSGWSSTIPVASLGREAWRRLRCGAAIPVGWMCMAWPPVPSALARPPAARCSSGVIAVFAGAGPWPNGCQRLKGSCQRLASKKLASKQRISWGLIAGVQHLGLSSAPAGDRAS